MTHTPGPWAVIALNRTGSYEITSESDHEPLEARANNARLIAAAPELLAALREIATDTRRSTIDPSDIVPTAAAVLARAAILKAEGSK